MPPRYAALAAAFVVLTTLGMVGAFRAARRYRRHLEARDPEGAQAGTGSINAAVFGLLGLLLAFAFSGAESRFDMRRRLIIEETNAVSTP